MRGYATRQLVGRQGHPDLEEIEEAYEYGDYGDQEVFATNLEIHSRRPRPRSWTCPRTSWPSAPLNITPLADRPFGRYEPSQLITHAFLHADTMHLVGNVIFSLVIGRHINGMIGNAAMLLLYPLLAIGAGLFQLASMQTGPPQAVIGAWGAIMGLAGMYFILAPFARVHMVLWWRYWFLLRIRFRYWMFSKPGWAVLIFYIAFDVLAVLLKSAGRGERTWPVVDSSAGWRSPFCF